jgi:hypothetical protein
LITLRYPSGSQPIFIIAEGFAAERWEEFSIGDTVEPVVCSSKDDTWFLSTLQYASQGGSIGVVVHKADTLVEVPE